ncbi:MAG: type II secretion system F family protein [Proteobacteria bacterium]|nr:type II secretion system F family protein [Pseudomonadota bacterium]
MNTMMIAIGIAAFVAIIGVTQLAIVGYDNYKRRFTSMAQGKLEEQFVFYDANKLFTFQVIALALPVLMWFMMDGWFVPAVFAVVIVVAPRVIFAVLARRRSLKIVLQLPDMLLMLGSSLRAGTSLQIALDVAMAETPAPLSQEMGIVVREQRLGVAVEDALETMGMRLKLDEMDLVIAAMTIARDAGGNLAETLDQLAHTLRAKATMEGKIRSLTAQGKLQGWIAAALPLLLLVVMSHMQHDAMAPMFNTLGGYATLAVIGLMELCGYFFIRKIVNIDV